MGRQSELVSSPRPVSILIESCLSPSQNRPFDETRRKPAQRPLGWPIPVSQTGLEIKVSLLVLAPGICETTLSA